MTPETPKIMEETIKHNRGRGTYKGHIGKGQNRLNNVGLDRFSVCTAKNIKNWQSAEKAHLG